jgi:hypothetical protein
VKVCTGAFVEMFTVTGKGGANEVLVVIRFREREVEVIFAITRERRTDEVLVGLDLEREEQK